MAVEVEESLQKEEGKTLPAPNGIDSPNAWVLPQVEARVEGSPDRQQEGLDTSSVVLDRR